MEGKTAGTSLKKFLCYSSGSLGEDSNSVPVGISIGLGWISNETGHR
jgi:hypothetical protein